MVYFIQGESTQRVKIGKANDVVSRLRNLQACSPDSLTVRAVIVSEDDDAFYHHRFASSWSHAEWFNPTPELMVFVQSVPDSEYDGLSIKIKNLSVVGKVWPRRLSKSERAVEPGRHIKNSITRDELVSEIEAARQAGYKPLSIEHYRYDMAREYLREGELDAAHSTIMGTSDDYLYERMQGDN